MEGRSADSCSAPGFLAQLVLTVSIYAAMRVQPDEVGVGVALTATSIVVFLQQVHCKVSLYLRRRQAAAQAEPRSTRSMRVEDAGYPQQIRGLQPDEAFRDAVAFGFPADSGELYGVPERRNATPTCCPSGQRLVRPVYRARSRQDPRRPRCQPISSRSVRGPGGSTRPRALKSAPTDGSAMQRSHDALGWRDRLAAGEGDGPSSGVRRTSLRVEWIVHVACLTRRLDIGGRGEFSLTVVRLQHATRDQSRGFPR